jgi:hypothetical protein
MRAADQVQVAPVGCRGHGMPDHYQIRVKGYLDLDWSAWFDDFTITHDADGCTTIAGRVADPSALYGLISKARDLGLILLLVAPIAPEGAD